MTRNTHSLLLLIGLSQRLPGLMVLISLIAFNAPAYAEPLTREYNIPAGTLTNALNNLAEHSDLQVIYDTGLTQGLSSNGLKGSYSASAALQKLLSGTGLVYSLSDGEVTIRAADKTPKPLVPMANPKSSHPGSETMLAPVSVAADAIKDVTDPYNQDYVIPNATAGTKTDTPIMETPLNVQVISKQVLKDQQVIRLDQALKNVSGVTTRTNTNGVPGGILGGTTQTIFLRGFESQTFFRNGFRLQEGSASKGLANVESIEVLKGPAAILYGLVEPGGMVNVITKQPLATPYYGFTQQFGSYDLYRTTLDATGPITKNKDLLYRVNMSYENSGSFRDLVGKEDVFFAPVLKWIISPRTQATFEMEYNHQHLATDNGFVPTASNGTPLNVPISRNYGGYSPATIETIFGGFNWSHQFNDDWAIKHRFSVNQKSLDSPFNINPQATGSKTGFINLLDPNLTQPLLSQPEGNYVLNVLYGKIASQNNTYSTNLDLVGHFDSFGLKHTLLTGGDYYRIDVNSQNPERFVSYNSFNNLHPAIAPQKIFFDTKGGFLNSSKTDQYGLYIQDQIKLPYNFHVMGGIRYQYIHQEQSTISNNLASPTAQSQDAVTPRVGILWQPQSWVSLYANYVESFGANTGRAFVSTGVSTSIAPTSASQYEGGIKVQFFDNKLRANFAYYDLTKTNLAVGDPNQLHDCGGGAGTCSLALGEVRSRGPELDITGEVLPGWNVIGTWANTDIIVTKTNTNNDPTIPSGDVTDGTLYTRGSRLPNVPRNIGSLWSTYTVQDGNYKGLTFGGGATLRDNSLAAGFVNDPGITYKRVPGYATFGLMAGYSRQIGDTKVSVQLNVDNLLDKRAFNTFTGESSFKGAYVDFVQPRTFMGQVSVQY